VRPLDPGRARLMAHARAAFWPSFFDRHILGPSLPLADELSVGQKHTWRRRTSSDPRSHEAHIIGDLGLAGTGEDDT